MRKSILTKSLWIVFLMLPLVLTWINGKMGSTLIIGFYSPYYNFLITVVADITNTDIRSQFVYWWLDITTVLIIASSIWVIISSKKVRYLFLATVFNEIIAQIYIIYIWEGDLIHYVSPLLLLLFGVYLLILKIMEIRRSRKLRQGTVCVNPDEKLR